MPSDAKKSVDKGKRGTGGPPGTAAQRATKTGGRGRMRDSSRMVKQGVQLPNSQGK